MSSYSKWKDKWALVTGASSGIGAAFAKDLARSGVHVVLVARRLERLEALAAELSDGFGVQTLVLASDLAVSGAAQTMADELEAKGVEVELLVNNAGLGPAGAFSDGNTPKCDEFYPGQYYGTHRVNLSLHSEDEASSFRQCDPGRVGQCLYVGAAFAVYSATKAYVRSFGEAVAEECQNDNVFVTVVHPGGTRTEFSDVANMTIPETMQTGLMTAEAVAQIGLRGAHRGQISVVTGLMNRLFATLLTFIPRWITRPVVKWVYAKFI